MSKNTVLRIGTIYCIVGHAFLLMLVTGVDVVVQQPIQSEKEALLQLQEFLLSQNNVNRGVYGGWNKTSSSYCTWKGVSCDGNHVTTIDLSNNHIAGTMFTNFSAFTNLSYLDLSENLITTLSDDLKSCRSLRHLNLSRNMIDGEVSLTGMDKLEVLDLSDNRISWQPRLGDCENLMVLDLSKNNLTGIVSNESSLESCKKLQILDLSGNFITGSLLISIGRYRRVSLSNNKLSGNVPSWVFPQGCSLIALDLSENNLTGDVLKEISNCKELMELNLWGNKFSGQIPDGLGLLSGLQSIILSGNKFFREIPRSFLGLSNLTVLDLSRNSFGGDIQEIFGELANISYLILYGNSYTGGLRSSGILKLQNLRGLDLSNNNLSGPLPSEISQMSTLKVLTLSSNRFSGVIPQEYGKFERMQFLDLSFNELEGSIPASFGKLSSLLSLIVSNNLLSGAIPPELGNCSSLLWLNLANNQLSGKFPAELGYIGNNATPTFMFNRLDDTKTTGLGDCATMTRWLPDSALVNILPSTSRNYCVRFLEIMQKGYGFYTLCSGGSEVLGTPGYVQLSNNQLSGQIPSEISRISNLGYLSLGSNRFSGKLPSEIGLLSSVQVLDVSKNELSGEIPMEVGDVQCLYALDLSYNNFTGDIPNSLSKLTNLGKFNLSYNPLITGKLPSFGQLSTFTNRSFLGLPLFQYQGSSNPNAPSNVVEPETERAGSGFHLEGKHVFFITFPIFFTLAFLYFTMFCNIPLTRICKI